MDNFELFKVARKLNEVFGEPCNYEDSNDEPIFQDCDWCGSNFYCKTPEICWVKFMENIIKRG